MKNDEDDHNLQPRSMVTPQIGNIIEHVRPQKLPGNPSQIERCIENLILNLFFLTILRTEEEKVRKVDKQIHVHTVSKQQTTMKRWNLNV